MRHGCRASAALAERPLPAGQTPKTQSAALPSADAPFSLCLRVLALSKYFYFYEVDEKSPVDRSILD